MRESGNWHPALDALFYSDVSAPESGYCLGDSSGFGAYIADHRPRAMIFKWAVVVLMGSYIPKANSSQLWLNRIVWKTFKNMLSVGYHEIQWKSLCAFYIFSPERAFNLVPCKCEWRVLTKAYLCSLEYLLLSSKNRVCFCTRWSDMSWLYFGLVFN